MARLRDACGDGRISISELGERTEAAYAARTTDELDALTSDLPVPPTAPAPRSRRRSQILPGNAGFSERTVVPSSRGWSGTGRWALRAPQLERRRFALVSRSDRELVFEREDWPGWVFLVLLVPPLGLVALLTQRRKSRIVLAFEKSPGGTEIAAYGRAPLPVRRAFPRLRA